MANTPGNDAKWGGPREGSGRPKMGVVRINITLTEAQVEWLKSKGNTSEYIRKLIDAEMEKEQ